MYVNSYTHCYFCRSGLSKSTYDISRINHAKSLLNLRNDKEKCPKTLQNGCFLGILRVGTASAYSYVNPASDAGNARKVGNMNNDGKKVKIVVNETGEVIGEVETNHSMDIYTACRLAGLEDAITPDENGESEYDADRDLELVY